MRAGISSENNSRRSSGIFTTVMAGHSRSENGVAFARLCRGHPRFLQSIPKDAGTQAWRHAFSSCTVDYAGKVL
jgi:hypothetical protein